ncbi:MAG: EAL domain-containing protein [Gemmatimonadota bacterium]|nr:EAL domain-containing protein [Gemmatimonadota bacterium]
MTTFVARQPIFDLDDRTIGFELLYRTSAEENWAFGADEQQMSSDVIIHSVLGIGLERITGGKTAFINFTSDMLVTDLFELLDPRSVVIELLERITADEYVARACDRLAAKGYRLALGDYAGQPSFDPILRVAEIVKVDVLGRSAGEVATIAARLRRYGVRMLAKRVETAEVHAQCKALGFELFQGYHFGRPEILSDRDIPVDGVAIMRALNALRNPGPDDADLEDAFRASPLLTYQLLRIVSSALPGHRATESVTHAIRLLGCELLLRWLSLLFVSSLVARADPESESAESVLLRARLGERIGEVASPESESGPLFLAGLLSGLGVLTGMPLGEALDRIGLTLAVHDGALGRGGPYAPALELAAACTAGRWDRATVLAAAAGIGEDRVKELYLEALAWARERVPVPVG